MLSEIRFFLLLRGVLKAFRATWQSLMKNEIASFTLAMTWFSEYLQELKVENEHSIFDSEISAYERWYGESKFFSFFPFRKTC